MKNLNSVLFCIIAFLAISTILPTTCFAQEDVHTVVYIYAELEDYYTYSNLTNLDVETWAGHVVDTWTKYNTTSSSECSNVCENSSCSGYYSQGYKVLLKCELDLGSMDDDAFELSGNFTVSFGGSSSTITISSQLFDAYVHDVINFTATASGTLVSGSVDMIAIKKVIPERDVTLDTSSCGEIQFDNVYFTHSSARVLIQGYIFDGTYKVQGELNYSPSSFGYPGYETITISNSDLFGSDYSDIVGENVYYSLDFYVDDYNCRVQSYEEGTTPNFYQRLLLPPVTSFTLSEETRYNCDVGQYEVLNMTNIMDDEGNSIGASDNIFADLWYTLKAGGESHVNYYINSSSFTFGLPPPTQDYLEEGTYYQLNLSEEGKRCASTHLFSHTIEHPGELIGISLDKSRERPPCVSGQGYASGLVTASGSNGMPPYEYRLNSGSWTSSSTFAISPGSSYTIYVQDDEGCITSGTGTIPSTPHYNISATTTVNTEPTCSASSNGQITASVSNSGTASGSYSYTWDGPVTKTGNPGTSLEEGSYDLLVESPLVYSTYSCQYEKNGVVLNSVSTMITSHSKTDINCFGFDDGRSSLTWPAGESNTDFNYTWKNSEGITIGTDTTITGLQPGSYSGTIAHKLDTVNCHNTYSFTITEPDSIVPSLLQTAAINCKGDYTGALEASPVGTRGQVSYSWGIAPSATNLGYTSDSVLTGLGANTYIVCVYDTISPSIICTGNDTITITEPTEVVFNSFIATEYPSGHNISCSGLSDGAITVSAGGGTPPYDITLYDDTRYDIPADTDVIFDNLTAGYDSVFIKDHNNCEAKTIFELISPDLLELSLVSDTFESSDPIARYNVPCHGDSGSITALASGGGGGFSYTWTQQGGSPFTTGTSILNNCTPNIKYFAEVEDINNCEAYDSIILADPPELLVSIVDTVLPTCYYKDDGHIIFTAEGGVKNLGSDNYKFFMKQGSTLTADTVESDTADFISVPGDYTLFALDYYGCEADQSLIMQNRDTLTVKFNEVRKPKCNGGDDALLKVSGSKGEIIAGSYYKFRMRKDGVLIDSLEIDDTVTFSGLMAGYYRIDVVDAVGCQNYAETTIGQPASIEYSIEQQDVSCAGGSDGELSVINMAGGTGDTVYWQTNWISEDILIGTSRKLISLTEGYYDLTIIDSGGCEQSQTDIYIDEPEVLSIYVVGTIPASGEETGDGAVYFIVTGGWPSTSYEYSVDDSAWSTLALTDTFALAGLDTGQHVLKIRNMDGCEASDTFNIAGGIPSMVELNNSIINKIMVYPNPNNGQFDVSIQLNEPSAVNVSVYNYLSSKLIDTKEKSGSLTYTFNFNLGNLPQGIYALKINTGGTARSVLFVVSY